MFNEFQVRSSIPVSSQSFQTGYKFNHNIRYNLSYKGSIIKYHFVQIHKEWTKINAFIWNQFTDVHS
jgi:hypothetical protein